MREAELDSLAAPSKKNVSVIVRCSTPDPEAECSKNNTASHFPEKVPEDFSIPLNYFIESFENPEAPPLPPRHPVYLNNTPHIHSPAPGIPWTPPRHNHTVKARGEGETSLIEGFRSPRTSALLKPLINLNNKEEDSKMADLDRMKDECDEKLMIFESLIRRHDPSRMDPVDV